MDTTKQPMIKTDAIMLIESNFIRYPENPNIWRRLVQLNYEHNINSDSVGNGFLTLLVSGTSKENGKVIFEARVRYLGVFISDPENQNLPLEEFLRFHAPAHIYPYAREFLTTLSTRSGMPSIILPPVNMSAVLNVDMKGVVEDNSITPTVDNN
ncbi:MAG: protein-export chaperone SecB [Candidatus Cloacimonadaceae bacterium]|nr:protein-export chaperone SecB [Candidatus Cloacimonadaceae bacterium]